MQSFAPLENPDLAKKSPCCSHTASTPDWGTQTGSGSWGGVSREAVERRSTLPAISVTRRRFLPTVLICGMATAELFSSYVARVAKGFFKLSLQPSSMSVGSRV